MNKKIDEKIKGEFQKDSYIPKSTQNAINEIIMQNRNTVINLKPNKLMIFKKLVTIMASFWVVFIGSITAYAAFGGTISVKPIFEWLGSNFDKEYENYKTEVQDQAVVYGETTIELLSKMFDDGVVTLEFHVKIGEEDMKTLDIWENQTINGIYMTFNGASNNWIATIDNKEYGIKTRSAQSYKKIADNEYIVYHMYFLTDKELKDKTDFKINILYAYINAFVRNDGESEDFEACEIVYVDCRRKNGYTFF